MLSENFVKSYEPAQSSYRYNTSNDHCIWRPACVSACL